MARSLGVAAYLGLSRLAYLPGRALVARRLRRGKEHPQRWPERLGIAGQPRPDGALIWFHAASVGEAVALLDLIRRLLAERADLHILITTVTRTSAAVMEERLPERALHQFAPVDALRAVKRFLAHWRPDAAVWTESELWPALLHRTKLSGCPLYLVNARISVRSAQRLRWAGRFAGSLLSRFDRILAQDAPVAARLRALGAPAERIEVAGSLKEVAAPLPVDEAERADFA
ncbi:MAG: glycosyltransferase N-terminal domain-containing protein, partial [Pseudomonadota bacterium]